MLILMVASMMVSCNSCMRSSAEPVVTKQQFEQSGINTQPITNQTQRDALYSNLEKTERAVIGQQKKLDSLMQRFYEK